MSSGALDAAARWGRQLATRALAASGGPAAAALGAPWWLVLAAGVVVMLAIGALRALANPLRVKAWAEGWAEALPAITRLRETWRTERAKSRRRSRTTGGPAPPQVSP